VDAPGRDELTREMRVLILHSRYLSGAVSGENRVVEDESRILREGGHDVRVVSPEPDASGPVAQIRVGASAVWSAEASRRVGALVRRHDIEIVHAHNLFPTLSPSVLRAAAAAGAAVVVTLHNFRMMCLPATFLRDGRVCEACLGHLPWRGVVYRCYRESALGSAALASSLAVHRRLGTFGRVSRYLAVSDFVREKHIEGGMPADRIGVKGNFTWAAEPRRGPGEYFLFVGRLSPEKGLDTLLRAWRTGPSLGRLVVIGDGPQAADLRAMAPAGVEFGGEVPSTDVAGIMARARALMVPSRWYEASPRTIIEAYAAGVPVIASRIGALPEAVEDGVSGYLAPPDDAAAWADAASRMTDDREAERLGAGALARWRARHSPVSGLAELEGAYEEALAAR
jgi:glycosyltransferase involved in cell wall biosynthesis